MGRIRKLPSSSRKRRQQPQIESGASAFVSTVGTSTVATSIAVNGLFTGLGAGPHTVSTWARSAGGGGACEESDGNGGVDNETVGDVLVLEGP